VKIAVFSNAFTHETALTLGKIITSQSVEVVYYETDRIWDENFCKNPLTLLDNISHMLFVYSSNTKDLSAFIFLSGFCLGKGIRVLVLESDAKLSLPANCSHLGVFLRPESFEEFFIAEKSRFFDEDKKDRAKADLLARGISCYEDNFIVIVSSGDAAAVRLFIDAGFSVSSVDAKGIPLLSLAVRSQFPEIVNMLLEAGADINELSGDRGYSPLMDAVQKGDVAMVELLLRRGANTELKSKDGQTALILCAGRGDVPMAKILIAHGSNPSVSDHLGMTAIKYANLFKNEKMIELFNTSPA